MTHKDYLHAVEFASEVTNDVIKKLEQVAIEQKREVKISTEYIHKQSSFVVEVGNMNFDDINKVAKSVIFQNAHATSKKSGYILIEINL